MSDHAWVWIAGLVCRVGQNRISAPYMTVYLVSFLPKIPYIHRIYMVLANPTRLLQLDYVPRDLNIGVTTGYK